MSSPSEFLTFYRRATMSTPRMLRSVQRPATRSFAISAARRKGGVDADRKAKTDKREDTEHSVNKAHSAKGDTYDVQSSNAKDGMDSANTSGSGSSGGTATERKDTTGSQAKARNDFPEAPDLIGMQDERGGRGA
ncbi:uncharacterized protein CC84DRAFT_1255604 [Paraphaeosphaeria sporulosa]|uniref:Uncharacterized protein n=1 Tax=Paraphaeosphaeria sporulosa TaxID=1460663 RepID=A0A177CQJ7_9PLEO|nr:uncharacterized protein CC84DRAFT_1255604 [Paraphaeosphaeria sporulosa]OAG09586.1 hypothetical protein CC84DRAFT_1255604 [Paraphaeosphaeria sporulosa]